MPTRIFIGGQAAWTSGDYEDPRRRLIKPVFPARRDGALLRDQRVEPSAATTPFLAGVPYYDPDDGIEYRAVQPRALDLRQGWRTAEFWLDRWGVDWKTLRTFFDRGWLDAAIETGGATKRFRCRDEESVLAWIKAAKMDAVQAKVLPSSPTRTKRSRKS
jgi:hypothetical protein